VQSCTYKKKHRVLTLCVFSVINGMTRKAWIFLWQSIEKGLGRRDLNTKSVEMSTFFDIIKSEGGVDMSFFHCDNSDKHIILHDCIAEKAYFQNGILGFEFEDGFWITLENPKNNCGKLVRTDHSKAEFVLSENCIDDFCVYVFKKYPFGITVRKELSIKKFIDRINRKKNGFEFLYQYTDENMSMRMIEGVFRSERKPYFEECELRIYTDKVNYYWNNLREDRVW